MGCFSPFPHGTGSLSVRYEYLGLEGGPPKFRQGFTCPALLKNDVGFTRTGLSPTMAALSNAFWFASHHHWPGPLSLVTTSGVSVDVLSSGYMRYFSSPGLLLNPLQIQIPKDQMTDLPCTEEPRRKIRHLTFKVGCPIRKSTDQSLLTAPRGLSQRATSFIACICQGIHQTPFSQSLETSSSRPNSRTKRTHSVFMIRHLFQDQLQD